MMRFSLTVDIARPINELFHFVSDFTNVPLWNYYVKEVQQLTPGPVDVGTVYNQVRPGDQQRYRVTAHDAPRTVAIATLPGERPTFHRRFHLETVDHGFTSLSDHWQLDTGHARMLEHLASARIQDGIAQNLDVLRRLLEDRVARLPDGRSSRLPFLPATSPTGR